MTAFDRDATVLMEFRKRNIALSSLPIEQSVVDRMGSLKEDYENEFGSDCSNAHAIGRRITHFTQLLETQKEIKKVFA